MGLDVFVGASKGSVDQECITIGDSEHEQMLRLVQDSESFRVLRKFEDYYSDAVIHTSELQTLIEEIRRASSASIDEHFVEFLRRFEQIASTALRSGKKLIVLSD
jgi:hypothetical protein